MKQSWNNRSRNRLYRPMFLSLVLAMLLIPATAFSATRLVIDFDQMHVRGRNMILPLKRHIREHFPEIDLHDYKLVKVKLVAKSRKGHGQSRLIVGSWDSSAQRIGGKPRKFHRNNRRTYKKMTFENNAGTSRGRWQLRLDGNIKINRVVVKLRKKRRHFRRGHHHHNWSQSNIIEPQKRRTVVVQQKKRHVNSHKDRQKRRTVVVQQKKRHVVAHNDHNRAIPELAFNLIQLLARR